jgi:Na+/H+ antiporter NhaD/arsenite permease-like protein
VDLPLWVFVAVYAVMILGRVPGLAIDRTGACLLGAVVLLVGGALGTERAWRAVDAATIGLLLGMMLVSAQLRTSGLYDRATRWLAARPTPPQRLLAELIGLAGASSALLSRRCSSTCAYAAASTRCRSCSRSRPPRTSAPRRR